MGWGHGAVLVTAGTLLAFFIKIRGSQNRKIRRGMGYLDMRSITEGHNVNTDEIGIKIN